MVVIINIMCYNRVMKKLYGGIKMVENRICSIWEYLPLRQNLKKSSYILGAGELHVGFTQKHSARYKTGKIGIKKCFQLSKLYFYIRFEAIYKPNLAGTGVATPPAFFVCPCSEGGRLKSPLHVIFLIQLHGMVCFSFHIFLFLGWCR